MYKKHSLVSYRRKKNYNHYRSNFYYFTGTIIPHEYLFEMTQSVKTLPGLSINFTNELHNGSH